MLNEKLTLLPCDPQELGKLLRAMRAYQDLQKQHTMNATDRSRETVTAWERGTSAIKFIDLHANLNMLGYEILIREKTNA